MSEQPAGGPDHTRLRADRLAREELSLTAAEHDSISSDTLIRTLHDLRVHQIELEMQNDELRRAHLDLEVARARYFDLFDLAPVGYCTLDEEGRVVESNLTLAAMLGVFRDQLLKQRFSRYLLTDDDVDRFFLLHQKLLRTGHPDTCELQLAKENDNPLWVRAHVTAARSHDGANLCRISITDFTPGKVAQERLIEERQKRETILTELFEEAPIAYQELDRDGRVCRVNAAQCALLGYAAHEILGRPGWDLAAASHREACRQRIQHSLSAAQALPCAQFAYVRKDGRQRLLEFHDRQVIDEAGAVIGLRSAMLDITERDRAEQQLRASVAVSAAAVRDLENQRFALDHHSIVAVTDIHGFITSVNDKFCAISGYSREELLGQNHRLVNSGYHPREFFAALWLTISQGQVWHGEICNRAKDGSLYWVESTVVPMRGPLGEPGAYIAIQTDITVRKRDEEALKLEKDRAQASTIAKSDFLASMSHEIRTPMNGVIGMTGLLLGTPLTGVQKSYVETVRTSAEALLAIINDILDFSKVEAGKVDLEVTPFNLLSALEDVVDLMAVKAREKHLDLLLLYPPAAPRDFLGDPGRIRQVVLNLVSNAIKFTEYGHVLVEVDYKSASTLSITVQDTGIGIPENRQTLLFQKFQQLDSSTTRKYGGTGLGLAISKELIDRMGGSFHLSSQEGKGSSFSFEIPLALNLAAPADARVAALSGLRVLVADPAPLRRCEVTQHFRRWGSRVDEGSTFDDAVQLAAAALAGGEPYHLVCLGCEFPRGGASGASRVLLEFGLPAILFLAPGLIDSVPGPARLSRPLREAVLFDGVQQVLKIRPDGDGAPSVARPPLLAEGPARFTGRRVLTVEDNVVNQKVAVALLSKLGCLVDVAANGREGADMAAGFHYDLILMDCHMPEMDGFEATREIRLREGSARRTPIIALTAGALVEDRQKCRLAGMDDYLSKPTKASDLTEMLARFLPVVNPNSGSPVLHEMSHRDLDQLVTHLLAGDFEAASSLLRRLSAAGVTPENIYLELLQPALHRVGELWAAGRISVATEHLATAVTSRLLPLIHTSRSSPYVQGRSAVISCIPGEQHQLGARIIADLMEMYGWKTYFLGQDVPIQDLLEFVGEKQPALLILSMTFAANLPALRGVLDSVHRSYPALPVFLGGQAIKALGPGEFAQFENVRVIHATSGLEEALLTI